MARKRRPKLQLENLGSMITFKLDGKDRCLGYLWHAEEHGTYDATYGRVDVSKEDAAAHNAAFDKANVEGLDNQCEIGQGSIFYVGRNKDGSYRVSTWIGTVIAENARTSRPGGATIAFERKGRKFFGRLRRTSDMVFITRTA